jgi:hypothetical protein
MLAFFSVNYQERFKLWSNLAAALYGHFSHSDRDQDIGEAIAPHGDVMPLPPACVADQYVRGTVVWMRLPWKF